MVLAPAKARAEIVQRVSSEIGKVLTDPEVRKTAATLGFEIDPNGPVAPAAAAEFLTKELAASGTIIKELGIEPQ